MFWDLLFRAEAMRFSMSTIDPSTSVETPPPPATAIKGDASVAPPADCWDSVRAGGVVASSIDGDAVAAAGLCAPAGGIVVEIVVVSGGSGGGGGVDGGGGLNP